MDKTGIDPYYVARFKADSTLIKKIIKGLNMKIDTNFMQVWIPEESPSWFSPSIDYQNNVFPTFVVEKSGKREVLYYDENQNIAYYYNCSW